MYRLPGHGNLLYYSRCARHPLLSQWKTRDTMTPMESGPYIVISAVEHRTVKKTNCDCDTKQHRKYQRLVCLGSSIVHIAECS